MIPDSRYQVAGSRKLVYWSLGGWLISVGLFYPFGMQSVEWVYSLLLFAVFILIPIGHKLYQQINSKWQFHPRLLLLGAIFLSVSFHLEQGLLAGVSSFLWLLLSGYYAAQSLYITFKHKLFRTWDWCFTGGFLFLLVGTIWAFADRLGYRPLGFAPIIVLLTAIHFHYAGFLMPILAGMILQKFQYKHFAFVAWGVLLGIPLVAIGITTSEFMWPPPFEVFAATVMALSGMAVALLYFREAIASFSSNKKSIIPLIGSLCLFAGMVLAILYGWRYYFPLPFLSIPWMYAVHGSLNVLGTGLLVVSISNNQSPMSNV